MAVRAAARMAVGAPAVGMVARAAMAVLVMVVGAATGTAVLGAAPMVLTVPMAPTARPVPMALMGLRAAATPVPVRFSVLGV